MSHKIKCLILILSSHLAYAKNSCDWHSVQAANRLKDIAQCSGEGKISDLGACTPIYADFLSDSSKAALTNGLVAGIAGGYLGDRVPQLFLNHVEKKLLPHILTARKMFDEKFFAGSIQLTSEIKTNVGNFRLISTGKSSLLISETGKKFHLGPSNLAMQALLTDVDNYVMKSERATMNSYTIRQYAWSTHRYPNQMTSANPFLINFLKKKLRASTVTITHTGMQAVLTEHMMLMQKNLGLSFAALHPAIRSSLALKNFMSPGLLRSLTLGLVFGIVTSATTPLLGDGFTIACSPNDYLRRLKSYPLEKHEVFEDRLNHDFKVFCERSIYSLEAMTNTKISDISCDKGVASFNLEHFPTNLNYCSNRWKGDKVNTPIQVFFQGKDYDIQSVSYSDSKASWKNKWKDLDKKAPHHLFTKVSGVIYNVLQECKNRSVSSHPAVSQLSYGVPRKSNDVISSSTRGSQVQRQ